MSGKKQVIHVKDLVIEADNVYVERPRNHRPHHRDRLFESRNEHGERENRESSTQQHHHEDRESFRERQDNEFENRENRGERRPFDWI